VRPEIIEAAGKPYAPSGEMAPFNLLVFGGSQGAQFFSQIMPEAVAKLSEAQRSRLVIVQQARAEDETALREAYSRMSVNAKVAVFFTDLAKRMSDAHMVISRSGASTVSEIAVIGRPALLVPYPYALDHDQAANAAALAASGGASVYPQSDLSAEKMAAAIAEMMENPQRARQLANAAKSAGKPDAARLLADLAEAIAAQTSKSATKEGMRP
jgi:UDP-N-acetylglucosamine--N-acetylmuramyl-(pentapeptide) pyrophosphoryl-undecaprenol N-acetylglucosamine transferase